MNLKLILTAIVAGLSGVLAALAAVPEPEPLVCPECPVCEASPVEASGVEASGVEASGVEASPAGSVVPE